MDPSDSPDFLRGATSRAPKYQPIDLTKPSIARVYSYFLGGKDYFEVDKRMSEYARSVVPEILKLAIANRSFVQRAVRFMAEQGVDQFLDIGSGLPSDGNIHEIAQEVIPAARVVYVDKDLTVLSHAQALLVGVETCAILTRDLLEPEKILTDDDTRRLLDFSRPVGLILGGILHHLSHHRESLRVSAVLRDALPVGSYIAVSHFKLPDPEDAEDHERAKQAENAFLEKLGTGRWSPPEQIMAYFGDFTMVEPGLVNCDAWHKTKDDPKIPIPIRPLIAGGVAQKRA
ncbi:S-adenosyl methyltransferase [Murinocardiopsis flavida]|uniref:S-adenosyl methyltransferase n=1 Tax=Murinocardiopsis flavida TaxID=645275 RepID=A0A2P8D2D9_9ACTN|nr:SAM-dependent methyltransferase [Murinocardiopsis flavida]PSK91377.1 S-adenosyl methyltransferase [Murinocardiopsis flavida]